MFLYRNSIVISVLLESKNKNIVIKKGIEDMDYHKTGKLLALVLRHKPESIGLSLDENGWADVKELIVLINKNNNSMVSLEDLLYIVTIDNKQRYSFNKDKTKIRANQGHSLQVDVELKEMIPPDILYHGSATKYEESIQKEGLLSKTRLYVHLSKDVDTAIIVGKRHGEVIVYEVDCKKMINDHYVFYLSVNNVWLIKEVPVKYLKKIV